MKDQRITHVDAIIGQIIVSHRKKLDMDQSELAELLEIKQPALSRLERGESAANAVTLLKLAETFGISGSDLMLEFEDAKRKIELQDVKIVPKKNTSDGVALALLGAAALAFLISRPR